MKVLISGYYGFGNVGDEALLAGLVTGLVAAGHEPVVLSNDPAATRSLHGVEARHRVHGVGPALLECEAFVSGGGGLLQDRTSARSLDYYLSLLRAARALRKRVVVYGQSVGPLTPAGRRKVGRALANVPVAVRDEISLDLLAGLDVGAELVADPALLLAEPPAATSGHRPVLLLPRAGHPQLTESLAGVAAEFAACDLPVEAAALHPSEDDVECRRLSESLPGLPRRRIGDHHEALRLFGRASLIVSTRLHGLILAAVSRTPAIGLVYDPKVAGFLAASGGNGFEPPVDHRALVDAAREARPLDEGKRRELVTRAQAGIDWLDRTLRGERLP